MFVKFELFIFCLWGTCCKRVILCLIIALVACVPCHVPQCRSCLVTSHFLSRIRHYSVICVQQNKESLAMVPRFHIFRLCWCLRTWSGSADIISVSILLRSLLSGVLSGLAAQALFDIAWKETHNSSPFDSMTTASNASTPGAIRHCRLIRRVGQPVHHTFSFLFASFFVTHPLLVHVYLFCILTLG